MSLTFGYSCPKSALFNNEIVSRIGVEIAFLDFNNVFVANIRIFARKKRKKNGDNEKIFHFIDFVL
jgi:hypothetical protein